MKSHRRRLEKLKKKAQVKPRKKCSLSKQLKKILHALNYYCTQTTFHGLRFVVDPDLHAIERLLWLLVFAASSIVASIVIYTLGLRFQAAPTSISIDSMHYRISNLPFPSVTLCPTNRVDWKQFLEFERRIFPNDTDKESLETFRKIVRSLSMMSFGDFDKLGFLKNRSQSIHGLSEIMKDRHCEPDINITEMLYEAMPRCEKFISDCWWRNHGRDCCEIFEVQRTEFGFCYSFNSETAEPSLSQTPYSSLHPESRPRKTPTYGEWSGGVRVTIHLGNITKPPDSFVNVDGIVVMVDGPYVWPNSGNVVPPGSFVSLAVDCISGFATQEVLTLDENRIPCKYDQTGVYNQETCRSRCKRNYIIKYCGCNPSFMFTSTSERDCNVEDLICLADFNHLFIDYVNYEETIFEDPITTCDCPPECNYYIYNTRYTNVPLHTTVKDIMLDVHFIGRTTFRYKTDIVITKMDLLVSFGGVISLFLGGSLLSAVELLYYIIVAAFSSLCSRQRTRAGSRTHTSLPIVHTTVLPVLDYGPLKPPARRIPIFANYGLGKSNLNRY